MGATNIRFLAATDQLQIDIDGNALFGAVDFEVVLGGVSTVACSAALDTLPARLGLLRSGARRGTRAGAPPPPCPLRRSPHD
ncbi:MAG: hypothetical protein IPK66_15815 [Rhodospirillales bacterium]|nr:hypothetical protein [Rhodospirillales bacterium]